MGNFLFGGTEQKSTITRGQEKLLNQLGRLNRHYNPQTYATLADLSGAPGNSYQYDADNGAQAFNQGIVNPALQQLNQQIADVQHSSSLHSSANRAAQDQLRQNTMNSLNTARYQDMMQQQQLRQQAQEQAYARQLQSLGQLMGGNASVLGTQAAALSKTPGLLDYASGAGSLMKGLGSLI